MIPSTRFLFSIVVDHRLLTVINPSKPPEPTLIFQPTAQTNHLLSTVSTYFTLNCCHFLFIIQKSSEASGSSPPDLGPLMSIIALALGRRFPRPSGKPRRLDSLGFVRVSRFSLSRFHPHSLPARNSPE
jgi:hypothetical protein